MVSDALNRAFRRQIQCFVLQIIIKKRDATDKPSLSKVPTKAGKIARNQVCGSNSQTFCQNAGDCSQDAMNRYNKVRQKGERR
ncbi:MAG: hypothetical protein CMJ74_09175 [Planctomycetaceae bacterium]|nr:hypothetical protein [Planctomycetaceae bacterium]